MALVFYVPCSMPCSIVGGLTILVDVVLCEWGSTWHSLPTIPIFVPLLLFYILLIFPTQIVFDMCHRAMIVSLLNDVRNQTSFKYAGL